MARGDILLSDDQRNQVFYKFIKIYDKDEKFQEIVDEFVLKAYVQRSLRPTELQKKKRK
jgi:hypothetical protein